MNIHSKATQAMAQSKMSSQKGRTKMNKLTAHGRWLIPVVVALAVLAGALLAAPAVHAGDAAGRRTPKQVAGHRYPRPAPSAEAGGRRPQLAASAAQADNCTYSSDRLWAMCPDMRNSSFYLYQAHNGQWYKVATAWVSGSFTYLTAGGATIAKNNQSGETWFYNPTSMGWINVTGMNSQAVNNAVVTNQISHNQVRLIQTLAGITSLPSLPLLWP